MPYNLRKRATPAPEPVVKKRRKEASVVKEEKLKQSEPVESQERIVEETAKTKKTKIKDVKPKEVKTKEVKTEEVEIKETKPKETKPKVTKSKITKPKESKVEESKVEEVEAVEKVEQQKSKPAAEKVQMMFGADSCGELGQGKIGIAKKTPIRVGIDKPIKQVACGPMHTVSLTEDGQVYTYGCNDEGALGRVTDGDEELEATPKHIPIKSKVIKITAGDSHTAVLTEDDEVHIWGNFRDEHGSVGLTPECEGKPAYEAIQILPDLKLKDIASGSNHILVLDDSGEVYSFGVGAQGQLGRLSLEEIGVEGNGVAITQDNRELFLRPLKVSFKNVDPQRPFVCDAIYAGNCSSFATNTDKKKNRLAGWGLNNYHQLGYKGQKGATLQCAPKRSTFTCSTSMIDVACGLHHNLFLTKTGRVYAAGRHDYGRLGLGNIDKEVCPAKQVEKLEGPIVKLGAGLSASFAVSEDGSLYSWGMGGTNLGLQNEEDLKWPTKVESLADKKVLSVSAGGSFTAVIVEGS